MLCVFEWFVGCFSVVVGNVAGMGFGFRIGWVVRVSC